MKPSRLQLRKASLRKKLRLVLSGISKAARRRKSKKALARLVKTQTFKAANRILIYMALPSELDTEPLMQSALKAGKEVYAPCIQKNRKQLLLYKIEGAHHLKKGSYGIREPRKHAARKGAIGKIDLVIVPGLGFDRKGNRLGRGGGYFDRLLAKATHAAKIGLAFKEQRVTRIPVEAHDIPVDRVITD